MRILLTGALGYLGRVVGPWLSDRGYAVTAVDSGLFTDVPGIDVRDLTEADVVGHDYVVHLAGLSNDACADLQPAAALEVNQRAAIRLAAMSRRAGARGFVFASSCSVYGPSGRAAAETDTPAPLSRYARIKLAAEHGVLAQADGCFHPVVLRFGTVYGPSASLRTDLVVNRMVACGLFDGVVTVDGNGAQRRPMVHVREVAIAIEAMLALLPSVRGEVFNVAGEQGNSRMDGLARQVAEATGARIVTRPSTADARDYTADGGKLRGLGVRLTEDLDAAIAELVPLIGSRFASLQEALGAPQNRTKAIAELVSTGRMDEVLRWRSDASLVKGPAQ